MSQPPRRIKSPFVKQLLAGAGVTDEGADPNAWPKVLDVASVVIEKAHEQKVITNGHVMAHAGGLIRFAMQFCPEPDRGRVFDEFVSELRGVIVGDRIGPAEAFKMIEKNLLNIGIVGHDRATGKHEGWSVSFPVRNGPTDWHQRDTLTDAITDCVKAGRKEPME